MCPWPTGTAATTVVLLSSFSLEPIIFLEFLIYENPNKAYDTSSLLFLSSAERF